MIEDRLRMAKLLEYVVAVLLMRNGYRAGVPQRQLQGRGAKHQIDVLAIDPLPMPFVFPTRVLCEVKCYSGRRERKLGIPHVRNLFAEVTDLQQTLPRHKKLSLDATNPEPTSCIYSGALFSTIPFSRPAIGFANSYAISLVPLPAEFEGRHLPTLATKLKDFATDSEERPDRRIAGCPHDCFKTLPFDPALIQDVMATGGRDILALREPEKRRVFVYALDCMLRKCPVVKDVNEALWTTRIAALDNQLALCHVKEPDFRRLGQNLAKRLLERTEEGFENLAEPARLDEQDRPSTYGPVRDAEFRLGEGLETTPTGFEWVRLHVLGIGLHILATRGTVKTLKAAKRASYFTMALDFGLVLNARLSQ